MEYYHSRYGSLRKSKRRKRIRWGIFFFILLMMAIGAGASYYFYKIVYTPNVWTANGEEVSIYIATGSNMDSVKLILYEKGLIIHRGNFEWWAQKKKYPEFIKPGHYVLKNGMNNNELINMLRSGNQVPVKVIFNNMRDIYQLAGRIGSQLEADSVSIVRLLEDTAFLSGMGYNEATIPALFIPNTYEFFWNTNAEKFIDRMKKEHDKFWSDTRKEKAAKMDLTEIEVSTLASIVDKESNKNSEKPIIAGVYINRLKAGWRLQADPTLIFAMNDPGIKRVLNVYLNFDSPYNTYLYGGLPPGPICIPSVSSIDAVLNYMDHDYLFFCAKDDLSGYHVFAKTNSQHVRNAKKYQEALNKMKIYK